ncbi:MAG: hypothetical protein CL916_02170 [Deltaproteobacteria bacterium]|nr:hypothetical protein [Deltaproteobacteria bacterium]
MYLVLSPAKRLHTVSVPKKGTDPVFWSESRTLAQRVQELTTTDLESLMKISSKLSTLNHDRFQNFSMEDISGTPAIQTFAGDTFVGMDSLTLEDEDIKWAQSRVGILSGLYGVLRPLDRIEPYRLEMGTKLKTTKGKDLYGYWGDSVQKEVAKRVQASQFPTLVNLASVEYFNVLKGIGVPVINPVFKEEKNGAYKIIALKAKRARGSMARFAIDKRLDNPQDLKRFDYGGYAFSPDHSDEQNWVFLR